mmetsp:Transcript_55466/g.130900  ORF Transcript_55466/g.130900 Transcript_55466/m.130900 type:complete len:205 (+) Transcript_55466:455-1069(+)
MALPVVHAWRGAGGAGVGARLVGRDQLLAEVAANTGEEGGGHGVGNLGAPGLTQHLDRAGEDPAGDLAVDSVDLSRRVEPLPHIQEVVAEHAEKSLSLDHGVGLGAGVVRDRAVRSHSEPNTPVEVGVVLDHRGPACRLSDGDNEHLAQPSTLLVYRRHVHRRHRPLCLSLQWLRLCRCGRVRGRWRGVLHGNCVGGEAFVERA